jgi:hypothetical protein
MIDTCEASVFVSIPTLAILYNLERIIARFAPGLKTDDLISDVF